MTTYLMAPDRAAATGGVKVMYGIASALRQLGHEAVVWQSASQTSSEALCANSLRLEAGDRL